MASLNRIVFGILILQMYVHAAPGDVSKLEDIAKVEQAEIKLDSKPNLDSDPKLDTEPTEVETENNSTETQRQKRWYNPYGYGFPPINPLVYPSIHKRDEGPNTGFYGGEDPLVQIHRRIQEIANIVRQPPPPPPPHIPIFYPVLFIPPGDCRCNENPTSGADSPPTPETDSPPTPGTDKPSTSDNNGTVPSVMNRWPTIDDERQNWGITINETDTVSDDGDEDFSRPISLDPIRLNRPMRPPPPVEHGSVQSDADGKQEQPQSETPSSRPPPPQSSSPPQNRPQNSFTPQSGPQPGLAPPSPCDGAILTCCHQPQVAYDCFAIQGCPDFTAYGNPCDPNLILRVIERFQTFYGQRGG